jgi:hypothetical protein
VPRPLILGALPPAGGAVILLILAVGAPHRAPAEQAMGGVELPIWPVYCLVGQSNFSKEALSGPQLFSLKSGIVGKLGTQRCRTASESQAEVEKSIESDGQQEALFVEMKLQGPNPKVTLWAKGKDHEGKIVEFPCQGTPGERCLERAMKDFPTDISIHDEHCHGRKQCRVDDKQFIVPLP